ncbi:MAG: hypothetical protein RR942_01245 [Romboutsia sp.]
MNKFFNTIKIIKKGARTSPIVKITLFILGIIGFAGIMSILPRLIATIFLISLLMICIIWGCYLEGLEDN